MEVIAVQSGSVTGWLEAATALGEIEFDSVQSLVDNIIKLLKGRTIDKLHLQAEGDSTGFDLGKTDTLDINNFKEVYRGQLSRLTPCFSRSDPTLVLRACEVGQNVTLLSNLAAAWKVTVICGRGFQNNLLGFNTGNYVTVKPDGSTETSILMPPRAKYDTLGAGRRLLQKFG